MDALEQIHIQCPYCGQPTELTVERTMAKQSYADECPVCCRTILLEVATDEDGELSITIHREDD